MEEFKIDEDLVKIFKLWRSSYSDRAFAKLKKYAKHEKSLDNVYKLVKKKRESMTKKKAKKFTSWNLFTLYC